MKKLIFTLLAVVAASLPINAQPPSSIVFNWSNPNSGFASCSSTVTTNCISGLTITDTTVSASPVVLSSTIAATAITYTTSLPPFTAATRTYSLVYNYKDSSGAAQSSSAATTSVTVPFVINAPTGFGAKLQ